jgi:hypothetical protein
MPIRQTPLSPLPFESFTLSLAAPLTVTEANPAPYSNTKEIILLNTSTADDVRVKVDVVFPALPATPLTNAAIIPPGASLTLAIGPEGYRNPLATAAFWALSSGTRLNLVFEAVTITAPAVSLDVNVTYVQSPGGGGGVTP